jgi:hypothetical protein
MALPYPIASTQTDALSPVDDNLMDSIRLDLEALDTGVLAVQSFDYQFKVNGPLEFLNPTYGMYKKIDGALVVKEQSLSLARLFCEIPGASGTLEVDLRKYRRVDVPITGIDKQFSGSITAIAQIAPAKATQSITRATTQISTQSISRWKSTININSIISLGSDNLWRMNLASAVDSDWKVGDSITVASATSGGNNGTFTIVRINDDGLNNIVITNASGVAQTSAAGNVALNAWAYVFTNPVNAQFAATESALFASHSTGANNGTLAIYAINSGGNNIIVKNASGVAQGGAAGTVDCLRWTYAFSSSAGSDFAVGEQVSNTSHSNAANNGVFVITAVDSGGNNVIIYNTAGVVQGGAAGTVDTIRWTVSLGSDPSSQVSVGQNIVISGASNANNNGTWVVKQVNRLSSNNIVIFNRNGATQGGAAGTLDHERMLIKFASDQSSIFTTESNVETFGMPSSVNMGYFDVVEVNRGGGANYNIVVVNASGVIQSNPAGRVILESKSIFTNRPSFVFPAAGSENQYNNQYHQIVSKTGADLNSNKEMTAGDVSSGVVLALDIRTIPSGAISSIVLQLA